MPAMVIAEASQAVANRISVEHTSQVRSLSLLACKCETEVLARYLCASEQKRDARYHFLKWRNI
jgi:hypothetical protein